MFPSPLEIPADGSRPDSPIIATWEPPRELAIHMQGPDGWFNNLEYVVESTAVVRYVHAGVFADDWDNQYDGASKHTDFYLHSLGQYVRYFAGKPVTYVSAEGPNPRPRRKRWERFAAPSESPRAPLSVTPRRWKSPESEPSTRLSTTSTTGSSACAPRTHCCGSTAEMLSAATSTRPITSSQRALTVDQQRQRGRAGSTACSPESSHSRSADTRPSSIAVSRAA
ncbi:hypothetical protein ACETU7_03270 [Rhodococcus sp. 3Y1]